MNDHIFQEPCRRTTRNTWIGSIIAAVLFLSIAAYFMVAAATASEPEHIKPRVLYVHENELFYRDYSDPAPVQLTQQLFDAENPNDVPVIYPYIDSAPEDLDAYLQELVELHLYIQRNRLTEQCYRNDAGTEFLYIDRYNGTTYDLCYRDLMQPDDTPLCIAEDVRSHSADTSLSHVVYFVWSARGFYWDGLFFYNRLTNETVTLTTEHVERFDLSPEGDVVVFCTTDDALYTYCKDTGIVQIAENISSYEISHDYSVLQYTVAEQTYYASTDGNIMTNAPDFVPLEHPDSYYSSPGDFYCNGDHYTLADACLSRNGKRIMTDVKVVRYNDDYVACVSGTTLYLIGDEQPAIAGRDVYDFQLLEDGSVLYLANFEGDCGDLYYWYNGRSDLLLDGITYFLHDNEDLRGLIW